MDKPSHLVDNCGDFADKPSHLVDKSGHLCAQVPLFGEKDFDKKGTLARTCHSLISSFLQPTTDSLVSSPATAYTQQLIPSFQAFATANN